MTNTEIKFKGLKALKLTPVESDYMVSLQNSQEFSAVLKRYGRVFTRTLFSSSKVPSRLQLLVRFGDMLLRLTKYHGPVFVVKYLKALTVALQRFIGGRPLSSLREIEPDLPLPRLATCGLPTFIPLKERHELKQLTPSVVRWWLTLFSIYRIISIPGKLKLETITQPYGGKVGRLDELCTWLLANAKQLVSPFIQSTEPQTSLGLEKITKSSPSAVQSWAGFMVDADSWVNRHEFFQFANFGQFPLWFLLTQLIKKMRGCQPYVPLDYVKFGRDTITRVPLGQLALKKEAAGKIRVFAMVDVWTQSVLKPLHNWLFDIFRRLPNDSTHNQDVGFLRAKEKAVYYGHSWCYDLSAATDRLPIKLQISILNSLLGHVECSGYDTGVSYGQAWAELLVNREYLLPRQEPLVLVEKKLKYAVGQPMGAYSSWAMLNLTHHLILQYINIMIYGNKNKWFVNYEVLGDDIVIFDRKVADYYLSLMEGDLDVKCNVSKSLVAPERPVIEFAKRTSIGLEEVSAFSWRQIRSFDSLFGRASVAADFVSRRGLKHPLRAFKAIVGPQWGPISSYQYSLISFAGILVNRGLVKFLDLANFLVDPKNPLRRFGGRIIEHVRVGVLERWVVQYWGGQPLTVPRIKDKALGRLFFLNQAAARGYLEDRIMDVFFKLKSLNKDLSFCEEILAIVRKGNLTDPGFVKEDIIELFFPNLEFRGPRLDDLDFEGLLEYFDYLSSVLRNLQFYKQTVERRMIAEDSLKTLRFIEKSKRAGSLSFEVLR